MAVPKKRTSKSKTQLRKTKWREKALAAAQNVLSTTLLRDPLIIKKRIAAERRVDALRDAARAEAKRLRKKGQNTKGPNHPKEAVKQQLKAEAKAKAAKPLGRGFGSQRPQVAPSKRSFEEGPQADVKKQQSKDLNNNDNNTKNKDLNNKDLNNNNDNNTKN